MYGINMNLTLEPMGDIKDENGAFLAGINVTARPKRFSVQGDDVVFEGIQIWNKASDPRILTLNYACHPSI
jgi:hypothetical protein